MAVVIVTVPTDFSGIQAALDDVANRVVNNDTYVVLVNDGSYGPITIKKTVTDIVPSRTGGNFVPVSGIFDDLSGVDYSVAGVQPDDILRITSVSGGSPVIIGGETKTLPFDMVISGLGGPTRLLLDQSVDNDPGDGPGVQYSIIRGKTGVKQIVRGNSKPIVDAASASYGVLVQADDVVLQDLDIINATIAAVGQDDDADDLVIRRCTLRDSPKGYENLVNDGNTSGLTITNCEVFETPEIGIDIDNVVGTILLAYLTVHVRSIAHSLVTGDTRALRVRGVLISTLTVKNSIFMAEEVDRTAVILEMAAITGATWAQNTNSFYSRDGALFARHSNTGASPFIDQVDLAAWRLASGQDAISFEGDPFFESHDSNLYFLRQNSPLIRAGESLGLADPTVNTDEDWQPTIRAVDGPSIGAHEVHDVVPFKGGARLIGIMAEVSKGVSRTLISTQGLEDTKNVDLFRPLAYPRTQDDFGDVVKSGQSKKGSTVTTSIVSGQAEFSASIRMDPRNDFAKAHDRKIDVVSELGLADGDGALVVARRIRGIPMDPLLANKIEWGTRVAILNAPSSDSVGAWSQLGSTTDGPGLRDEFGMVYDTSRNRVVVFGGWDLITLFNDVWEFTPVTETWTKIITINPPSPRRLIRMVYSSVDKVYYMFGGFISGALDETWKLDPATWTWTQLSPATVPPARWSFAMSYDASRDRTVMFGGNGAQSDTWEFDGINWVEFLPAGPVGRAGHIMEYDTGREAVALFGGNPISGIRLNDLWTFNGTAWTQLQLDAGGPPGKRSGGDGSYDMRQGRLVVFGGNSDASTRVNATHEWLSGDDRWVLSNKDGEVTVPAPREGYQMVYVAQEGYHLMYGGEGDGMAVLSDFWKYLDITFLC